MMCQLSNCPDEPLHDGQRERTLARQRCAKASLFSKINLVLQFVKSKRGFVGQYGVDIAIAQAQTGLVKTHVRAEIFRIQYVFIGMVKLVP